MQPRIPTRKAIEIVSFDLDGTLVSPGFADAVWLRGIPEAYARKEGICFEQALEFIKSKYEKIGENRIEWYTIEYWLREFDLELSYTRLFEKYAGEIRIYEEVESVLELLTEEGYELIVSSNAAAEFVEFQILPLRKFFSHVFSATSDFREVKKSNHFYARICEILNVEPHAVVHTGDHWVFDFLNPRKIGITAFYLDRSRGTREAGKKGGVNVKKEEEFIINDLKEILTVFVR